MSFDSQSDDAIRLMVENLQTSEQMRGSREVLTSSMLPALQVYLQVSTLCVTLDTVWCDFDKYRDLAANPGEDGGQESAEPAALGALLEKALG